MATPLAHQDAALRAPGPRDALPSPPSHGRPACAGRQPPAKGASPPGPIVTTGADTPPPGPIVTTDADTPPPERTGAATMGSFEDLYEEHFDFVWRAVRRLGVPSASVDDAVQDVFVVVHRRAATFEGRSSVRTWLFGIVLHVARDHRRRRKMDALEDPDAVVDTRSASPHAHAEAAEARRLLHEVLDKLDDERREVFVLIELSEMTAPEAAEALGVGLNTVYSRLRAARQAFDAEVQRRAARNGWRLP